MTDKNLEFAQLCGICWHTEAKTFNGFNKAECSCGLTFEDNWCLANHIQNTNPDFAADPRLVLREMIKRKDWPQFRKWISYYIPLDLRDRFPDGTGIKEQYILDTTGLLRDKAVEWLKGRER